METSTLTPRTDTPEPETMVWSGGPGTEVSVPAAAQPVLLRMFADPRQLERDERVMLIEQLRACVAAQPTEAAPRVLLGMALCVNYEVPEAIETLREAVQLEPENFMAQFKFGELWMRLRVMDQAADHTAKASRLATNYAQIELARRQAATIREMTRNGIERGGYKLPFRGLGAGLMKLIGRRRASEALALPTES